MYDICVTSAPDRRLHFAEPARRLEDAPATTATLLCVMMSRAEETPLAPGGYAPAAGYSPLNPGPFSPDAAAGLPGTAQRIPAPGISVVYI